MAQILGYTPEEMLGRGLLDFTDEEWRHVARQKLVDRAAGIVETHDFKFRRKDGSEIWALLSCAPILEGDVYKGALAMIADFTERRKLDEERKRHLQELKQVDRRKDEFLATVGHELRTPLATIKLAVDMLEKEAGLNQKSHDLMARIQRQVKHLTRMVEDVLQVSRLTLQKTHLEMEEFDLGELVAQTVDAHKFRFAEKGVRLDIAGAKEALPIRADAVRLSQVFGNLLDNAVKFTDRNGRVDVVVAREGDEAVVTVRDTGVGVAPERLSWIFELFNQMRNGTDRVREGIGVGLALARKFVELHGGGIEAKSDGVGKGAAFVVRLPLEKKSKR
jgi:PAS domain S-box-containing protein